MTLVEKLEVGIETKAPASKFLKFFLWKLYQLPSIVQSCELLEGEWGKVGAVISSNIVYDGKNKMEKTQVIEAVDEEKNLVTFKTIGGELLEHYQAYNETLHVRPRGEGGMVHWILELEKQGEKVPDSQTNLLQLYIDVSKDVDAHLTEPIWKHEHKISPLTRGESYGY